MTSSYYYNLGERPEGDKPRWNWLKAIILLSAFTASIWFMSWLIKLVLS